MVCPVIATPGASGPSTDTVTASGTGDNTGLPAVTDTASATCSVPTAGADGCTPGYWKQPQHFDSWPNPPYAPTTQVNNVFNVGTCGSLGSKTLLQALSFKGGSTFCAKVQLLLHAAVASVLNAASGVGFPYTVPEITTAVNAAIATGSATDVMALQGTLDAANNLGCPLN